jgi:hypothetical protein
MTAWHGFAGCFRGVCFMQHIPPALCILSIEPSQLGIDADNETYDVTTIHCGWSVFHNFSALPRIQLLQEGIDAISDVIQHIETYDVTTIRASTPMFLMSRKIKALGVKMVLSGEGSDEVFGGYLYFHKAPNRVGVMQALPKCFNTVLKLWFSRLFRRCTGCICWLSLPLMFFYTAQSHAPLQEEFFQETAGKV